jgi:hypothetical protein
MDTPDLKDWEFLAPDRLGRIVSERFAQPFDPEHPQMVLTYEDGSEVTVRARRFKHPFGLDE